jgi:hypothetical protein
MFIKKFSNFIKLNRFYFSKNRIFSNKDYDELFQFLSKDVKNYERKEKKAEELFKKGTFFFKH